MAQMAGSKKWTLNEIAGATTQNNVITGLISGPIDIDVGLVRPWAFAYCPITSATIRTSGNRGGWSLIERAFSFCHELEDVLYFPPSNGIGGIGIYTFWDCTKLKRVRITGNVSYIENAAFGSCPLLTDIYVTWAEGAVAGAPWGATNATIHYNTVFDANGNIIG